MSCSKLLTEFHIIRKRQITGRSHNTVFSYNDRSVMKRCIMFKNIDQKLTCQDCIDINACSDILVQTDFLFNNDQGTCLDFCHIITCFDQFIDCLVRKTFLYFFTCIKRNN